MNYFYYRRVRNGNLVFAAEGPHPLSSPGPRESWLPQLLLGSVGRLPGLPQQRKNWHLRRARPVGPGLACLPASRAISGLDYPAISVMRCSFGPISPLRLHSISIRCRPVTVRRVRL
jgi:hypothetical protein